MNAFAGPILMLLASTLMAPALVKIAEAPRNIRYTTPNHLIIEKTKLDATISEAMPVADNMKKNASALATPRILINVIFELGYLKREASKANIERDNVFKEDLFLTKR